MEQTVNNIIEESIETIYYDGVYVDVKITKQNVEASVYFKDKRKKHMVTKTTLYFPDGKVLDVTNIYIEYASNHDMYTKIQHGRYKNSLKSPSYGEIEKKYLDNVVMDANGSLSEIETKIKNAKEEAKKLAKEEYEKKKEEYYEETGRLENVFKKDLEEEFGVQNNPKKDLLYSKAYERGHSGGMYEVYGVYSDLVDLIK